MKGLLSNLLVVVNGSDSSISAVKYAICLASEHAARITAVYVVDTATIRQLAVSRIFVADESEEYERSLEETGKRYLAYCRELADAKRTNGKPRHWGEPALSRGTMLSQAHAQPLSLETRLLKGSIAGEVVKAAESIGADCIVVGGWERDTAFRDVIQEAYREIAKVAPCSILVVKSQDAEALYKAL